VKDSDAWKILRRVENYCLMMMDSLDAKLMDEDIYQKIGWKHKISNNWVQINQEKIDGKTM
jgi:hypothetical protein